MNRTRTDNRRKPRAGDTANRPLFCFCCRRLLLLLLLGDLDGGGDLRFGGSNGGLLGDSRGSVGGVESATLLLSLLDESLVEVPLGNLQKIWVSLGVRCRESNTHLEEDDTGEESHRNCVGGAHNLNVLNALVPGHRSVGGESGSVGTSAVTEGSRVTGSKVGLHAGEEVGAGDDLSGLVERVAIKETGQNEPVKAEKKLETYAAIRRSEGMVMIM